jgi:hypothetical protein
MECIPVEEFLYTTGCVTHSDVFDAKALGLLNKYKCFFIGGKGDGRGDPRWMRGKTHAHVQEPEKRPRKIVGVPVGSTEDMQVAVARKEFMPLMNKLTQKNKISILSQVKGIIKPSSSHIYMDIILNICLQCPEYQTLYMEVIDIITSAYASATDGLRHTVQNRFNTFIENSEYVPPDTMDKMEYDDFCDYVKWKKKAIASVNMYMLLEDKGVLQTVYDLSLALIGSCDYALNKRDYDKADIILEQLLAIYCHNTSVHKKQIDAITGFVSRWMSKTDDMRCSTKFKFYTFSEKFETKNSLATKENKWISKTRLSQNLRS